MIPNGTQKLNVIRNAGNGYGNSIVIDNGPGGGNGVTIVENVRNGIGNRVIVNNPGQLMVMGGKTYPQNGLAWTEKKYSTTMRMWLYWSPRDRSWFMYEPNSKMYTIMPIDLDDLDD